eukprot:CAMPEP_0198571866 /NCGR_PEP_ID=MMETSP1462-20131121/111081_1 /TAXON_ID=1333877 /ORGANISM="Brandtodinium nutriculum, Strain RCC3387" /LENGTH=53 /DNA_ID=CAMNT_0044303011 /DNA_START=54 /DNA_END=211 /DNA_ORIENTATION=-
MTKACKTSLNLLTLDLELTVRISEKSRTTGRHCWLSLQAMATLANCRCLFAWA